MSKLAKFPLIKFFVTLKKERKAFIKAKQDFPFERLTTKKNSRNMIDNLLCLIVLHKFPNVFRITTVTTKGNITISRR